jgi:hypothetical protein
MVGRNDSGGKGIVITVGIDRRKGCITALDKLLAWEPSCFIMMSMMIT